MAKGDQKTALVRRLRERGLVQSRTAENAADDGARIRLSASFAIIQPKLS
jgi:hypothetical protein